MDSSNICVRCDGEGIEYFEEDNRPQSHTCYHCSGSGYVEDDMAFHDKLCQLAVGLATHYVSEMQKDIDSDPDGEGWNFHAAENMMSGRDYFSMKVYDHAAIFSQQLQGFSFEDQKFLIAWEEDAFQNPFIRPKAEKAKAKVFEPMTYTEDHIPF